MELLLSIIVLPFHFGLEKSGLTGRCSHLVFFFLFLGQIQQFLLLKKVNPDVKLMLAIGGYSQGPNSFQEVVRKPVKRAIFVESAYNMIKQYSFDGLDIDWEYQDSVGGTLEDKVSQILTSKCSPSAMSSSPRSSSSSRYHEVN